MTDQSGPPPNQPWPPPSTGAAPGPPTPGAQSDNPWAPPPWPSPGGQPQPSPPGQPPIRQAPRSRLTPIQVLLIVGAAGLVFVLIVTGVFLAVRRIGAGGTAAPSTATSQAPPTPDTDLPAVADRYQGLGTTITAGMSGCESEPTQPGETERLRCDLPQGVLMLATFATAQDLTVGRDAARVRANEMGNLQVVSNDTGTYIESSTGAASAVYWDQVAPTPMGAYLTVDGAPPVAHTVWDARGFTAVARPVVPGSDLVSPALKEEAARVLTRPGVTCTHRTPDPGDVESYLCDLVGWSVNFNQSESAEAFAASRQRFREQATDRGTWTYGDAEMGMLFAVQLGDKECLYYDTKDKQTWTLMCAEQGQSEAELKDFWANQ